MTTAAMCMRHPHKVRHFADKPSACDQPCAQRCPHVCAQHRFLFFSSLPCAAYEAAVKRYKAGLVTMGGRELLVSCSDDFTLFLWDPADSKKSVVRMTGHQAVVNHISFSPDGRYIASASFDKKVKLWDGRTGKFLVSLVGHVRDVYQVCWSGDSRYVASASKDSTVKVWSARLFNAEGKATKPHALHTLAGHADEVYALDWSPNGEMIASGGRDRLVKMYVLLCCAWGHAQRTSCALLAWCAAYYALSRTPRVKKRGVQDSQRPICSRTCAAVFLVSACSWRN
ncbi:WD40 repeat domain-containing protein [archaeon]|nr:MAG: WD40 repeat domain-containing protein [archaeon]